MPQQNREDLNKSEREEGINHNRHLEFIKSLPPRRNQKDP